MSKYLLIPLTILSLSFVFSGCSSKKHQIRDITALPQQPSFYAKDIEPFKLEELKRFDKEFNENYFNPWHIESLSFSKEEAMWGFMYEKKKLYGQNYKLISKEWFEAQRENSNFEDYGKVLKKAVTIRNTNLRVYPTNKPLFGNPEEAGEGFPFDYNQNSLVHLNTPVFISHYSKDRAWAFIESNIAMGWISIMDIAFINNNTAEIFENGNYAVAIKDNFPLYNAKGAFIEYIKLGTIFPVKADGFMVVNSFGKIEYIENKNIVKKPISFIQDNVTNILNQLINEPYGWGGLVDTRDCSAMTRDFYTPFGIYLKRNSSQQAKKGIYLDIEKLSKEEKKEFIIKHGTPFKTLLYAKGHIMLYAGTAKDEPVIFHEFWGIRTKDFFNNEGRFIVGKTAFTTTEPGHELFYFDKDSALINKIIGVVQITQE